MSTPRRSWISALIVAAATVIGGAVAPPAVLAGSPGWLDATFGDRGVVRVPHSTAARDGCGRTVGLGVAATGRIFVGAVYCDVDGQTLPSEVVAFTVRGRLDATFGGGRPVRVATGDPTSGRFLRTVFGTRAGGLVTYVNDSPTPCDLAARHAPSGVRDTAYGKGCVPGVLDTSWGAAGLVTIDVPQRTLKPVIAVAGPDGSLSIGVAVTDSTSRSSWIGGVARLTAPGAVDTGFGTSGLQLDAPSAGGSKVWALTVDAGGRPIVSVTTPSGHALPNAFLVRGLASTGSLDPAFGHSGVVRLARPAVALAMAGASRILLASDVLGGLTLSARTD